MAVVFMPGLGTVAYADAPPETYNVSVTMGANMTADDSTNLTQNGIASGSAVTSVTITAASGYMFAAGSNGDFVQTGDLNGLVIERTDGTHITISGTATASVAITLKDAIPTTYNVAITLASGMELMPGSGALSQTVNCLDTGIANEIEQVNIRVTDPSKKFAAEPYEGTPNNSDFHVQRLNDSLIQIYGRPKGTNADVSLTMSALPDRGENPTFTSKVEPGEHMDRVTTSGALDQSNIASGAAITDIIFNAQEGYAFAAQGNLCKLVDTYS